MRPARRDFNGVIAVQAQDANKMAKELADSTRIEKAPGRAAGRRPDDK